MRFLKEISKVIVFLAIIGALLVGWAHGSSLIMRMSADEWIACVLLITNAFVMLGVAAIVLFPVSFVFWGWDSLDKCDQRECS